MLRDIHTGETVVPLDVYLGDDRHGLGRPWVLLNMIASIDGATAVEGRSTGLGDDDDHAVFKAIRAVPDVILVGASTVKAEDYRPVVLDDERRNRRRALGLAEVPRLVIVSGRLSLEPTARVFSDPSLRPTVLTSTGVDSESVAGFSEVADVVQLDNLSANGIVDYLSAEKVVLAEGGPSLNGQFAAADVLDEVNLTVAPVLVAGDSARIAHGEPARPPVDMRLDRVLEGDRSLFLRFVRS